METPIKQNNNRITVVDALRGFALVSIMVLHNIERFEVYGTPQNIPQWMASIDGPIKNIFFFIFGGKSYAIFALLFGLTFFIQTHNQEKAGKDFRFRFAWRMILLFGFGIINTMFYQGEILIFYALLSFLLIPFTKLGNKALLITAVVFLFQPELWYKVIVALINPDMEPGMPSYMPYYMKVGEFQQGNSLWLLMKSNLTNGRIASLLWLWEAGRTAQTLGLFLLGFLAGRTRILYNTPENISFWRKTLIISGILYIPLVLIAYNTQILSGSQAVSSSLGSVFTIWANLSLMLVMVSGFILLFYNVKCQSTLNKLSPIGKMSLSNYIIQSIIGSSIYYGFGLGMYRYTGSTYCLIIGIILAFAQGIFSTYWFKKHKRGPLESLWHKLTWLGADNK